MAYCTEPPSHVEQLNLQLAAPDTVVASFVTYEALPAEPVRHARLEVSLPNKPALTQLWRAWVPCAP